MSKKVYKVITAVKSTEDFKNVTVYGITLVILYHYKYRIFPFLFRAVLGRRYGRRTFNCVRVVRLPRRYSEHA